MNTQSTCAASPFGARLPIIRLTHSVLAVALLLLWPERVRAASLTLSFATNTISETQIENATTATIGIGTPLTNALTVTIDNGNSNELYLPATVSVPAGSNSVTFSVAGVNNPAITGPQTVLVIVSAKGFLAGSASITVLDDDSPTNLTIGGHLSGTLSSNVYHVTGNLTVNYGWTLSIAPAATLLFGSGVSLTSAGTLIARGTSNALIQFTSDQTTHTSGSWQGITVTSNNATFEYADIGFAEIGLAVSPTVSAPAIVVSNSAVHDCSSNGLEFTSVPPWNINGAYAQVASNAIYQNGYDGVYTYAYSGPGPSAPNTCNSSVNSLRIFDNDIYANGNAGIELEIGVSHGSGCSDAIPYFAINNCAISNNVIYGNTYAIYGYSDTTAYWLGQLKPTIENNLICDNIFGIWLSKKPGNTILAPIIVNNTIANNGNAGIYHDVGITNGFIIENNLLIQNQIGISAGAAFTPTNGVFAYNDLWSNSIVNWYGYPSSYGNPAITNLNGTPADINSNISSAPLFISGTDYHLQANSPAIDAGVTNNAPTNDIAGTARGAYPDLGAYEFASLLLTPNWPPTQGNLGITATGGRGTAFSIDTSTNLQAWTAATNSTLTNRTLLLQMPVATNGPQMFYRGKVK